MSTTILPPLPANRQTDEEGRMRGIEDALMEQAIMHLDEHPRTLETVTREVDAECAQFMELGRRTAVSSWRVAALVGSAGNQAACTTRD